MDVTAVFAGLAANAGAIAGLNTFGYVPDSISPPTFFTVEVDIAFDSTFQRGMDDWTITCRLLVSHADDRSGQKQLAGYLKGSGPSSVKAALESARQLGGACDDLHVTSVRGYGMYEHAGIHYYGAEFSVRVIGDGS